MTLYAWKITYPGRVDIEKVTELPHLEETLKVLDLPGLAPADWIVSEIESTKADTGRWDHEVEEGQNWSLIWTRFES